MLSQISLSMGRVLDGTIRSSQQGATGEVPAPRSTGGIWESNPSQFKRECKEPAYHYSLANMLL